MTTQSPLERAVLKSLPWLLGGLLAAVPLLLVPGSSDLRWDLVVHLSLLVLFAFGLTWRMPEIDADDWFRSQDWSPTLRFFAAATSLVVIVTGVTALVTLATTAALRFQPSLQYLQLLSSLDIAWVVAGTTLAVRSLWGRVPAFAAGSMMSIVCVMSIVLYLVEVGLTNEGGWLVDGAAMLRLILPFDIAAALITVTLLLLAARHSADRAGQSPVV